MYDGIKISYRLHDVEAWKASANFSFAANVNKDTGELLAKKPPKNGYINKPEIKETKTFESKGVFQTYELTNKESIKEHISGKKIVSNWLTIEGSLHKNYYRGTNVLPFNYQQLHKEIDNVERGLNINANYAKLDNLEFGVGVHTPFPVFPFLQKNLILFKNDAFIEYDPDHKGKTIGYHSKKPTQYQLKVYDKGLQNDLPDHLLRVELRYKKMEIPNKLGVYNLADLRRKEPIQKFIHLLLKAWDSVVLYDYDIDIDSPGLTPFQRDLLLNGKGRTYWQILNEENNRKFKDHLQKFKKLIKDYGNNYHALIRDKIEKECYSLLNNITTLPTLSNSEMYNLTIKVNSQNVHSKKCLYCGKDISHQKSSSKYCSDLRIGDKGKVCKNKYNNPIYNVERKIANEERKGALLFDIRPYFIYKKAN